MYRVDGGRRWRGAVTWTEADGTRRRRVVSGRTSDEARGKLDELRRELRLGAPIPKGRATTVAEYLDVWLARDAARVRPSTHAVRSQHVRFWLAPALGRIALARLTPADVERALADFVGRGRPVSGASGRWKAVTPRTVSHIRTTLRIAINDARRDGLVTRNVAADARPPRVSGSPIRYLEAEQARRLLETTRDDELGPLFALALSTGLRRGELLGLTWDDVDLEAGCLAVRRSMARTASGGYALGETKTSRSRRTIPLANSGRDALRRCRDRQMAQREEVGSAWQDRDRLVFTDSVGRPLAPDHVSYLFERALRAAGLPRVRFHDLRHSAATLMLAEGVPLAVVSDLLGHSSIAITSLHYAAVVPELRQDAAAALDRALGTRIL